MFSAKEISKRLFVMGILAIGLVPRQHIDGRSRMNLVGGDLSRPFKKLLVAHAVLMSFRMLINHIALAQRMERLHLYMRIVSDVLGLMQQVGLIFLCFLTPYLLRTWLAGVINLPGGRPGAALSKPLYLVTALTALSYLLSRLYGAHYWSLKKVANAMSSPVILQTLWLYNSVTTTGGNHQSRGSIISQTVGTMEVWYMVIQVCSAMGYILWDKSKQYDDSNHGQQQWQELLAACRDIGFYADWLRVGIHSIFINQLDEAYLTSASRAARSSSSPDSTTSATNTDNEEAPADSTSTDDVDTECASQEMVQVVPLLRNRN